MKGIILIILFLVATGCSSTSKKQSKRSPSSNIFHEAGDALGSRF